MEVFPVHLMLGYRAASVVPRVVPVTPTSVV
jgi:hypothetical protein